MSFSLRTTPKLISTKIIFRNLSVTSQALVKFIKRSKSRVRSRRPVRFKLIKRPRMIILSHYFRSTTTSILSSKATGSFNKILSIKSLIQSRMMKILISLWLLKYVRCIWASHMESLSLTILILMKNISHLEV